MSVIIAETKLFCKQGSIAKPFSITVFAPEKDPAKGGDYRCKVKITGRKAMYAYGIDTFQALNIAFVLIQAIAKTMVRAKISLYLDEDLECEFDIPALLLNDMSKYERLAKKRARRVKAPSVSAASRNQRSL